MVAPRTHAVLALLALAIAPARAHAYIPAFEDGPDVQPTPPPVATAPAPTSPSTPPRSREWVRVSIRTARIAERLQRGTTWDPDLAISRAEHDRNTAGAIGSLIGLVYAPVGTAITALAHLMAPTPEEEAPSSHPDVRLDVAWREGPSAQRLVSGVVPNSVRPILRYDFLVHAARLDAEGVRITLEDADGDAPAAMVGEVVLTRAMLLDAITRGEVVEHVLEDGELLELRVALSPIDNTTDGPSVALNVPLAQGFGDTGLDVPAGAIVTVTASGRGRIGRGGLFGCPPRVTPRGLPGDACRRYNLAHDAFRAAPHGSAVVMIGHHPSASAVALATTDPHDEPCVRFVARQPGRIVVGVNDNDVRNDDGSFGFVVRYAYPADGAARGPNGASACPR